MVVSQEEPQCFCDPPGSTPSSSLRFNSGPSSPNPLNKSWYFLSKSLMDSPSSEDLVVSSMALVSVEFFVCFAALLVMRLAQLWPFMAISWLSLCCSWVGYWDLGVRSRSWASWESVWFTWSKWGHLVPMTSLVLATLHLALGSIWKVASFPPFICIITSIPVGKVALTALTSRSLSVGSVTRIKWMYLNILNFPFPVGEWKTPCFSVVC